MFKEFPSFIKQSLDNVPYLHYFSLLFTSLYLVADFLSLLYLKNPIFITYNESISIFHFFILIISFTILYFFSNIIVLFLGLIPYIKREFDRNYTFSIDEIREKSITENNSIMYEEYKILNKERDMNERGKYFLFMIIVISIIEFWNPESSMIFLIKNYPFLFFIFEIAILILSIYYLFIYKGYEDYTGIRKERNIGLKNNLSFSFIFMI